MDLAYYQRSRETRPQARAGSTYCLHATIFSRVNSLPVWGHGGVEPLLATPLQIHQANWDSVSPWLSSALSPVPALMPSTLRKGGPAWQQTSPEKPLVTSTPHPNLLARGQGLGWASAGLLVT